MNIHRPGFLWKTLVDNVVDNVENYELSTDIQILYSLAKTGVGYAYPPA